MRKRTTTVALLVSFAAAGAALAPAAFADGSQDVVIGTTTVKTFTVSVTATDDQGIKSADITLNGPGQRLSKLTVHPGGRRHW
ncbi:hypothetical protein OHB25_34905 [Streptomyces mirabilis]|uniref:hypothetical protein n=1 Tax=Streptomyces TaxID=1883 RepID=UPI001163A181|nr:MULTISPECIES: hypothetical protein [Streptomyces]QDN88508.1 hypothetical protein FNV61_25455 [Streptomyces sp. RLB3-6]QDO09359.1 hypothetical protein FNV68_26700 [Streptomyces sp. S1D4-23]